ncbi:MAG: hypothetical protein AAF740_14600 [Bacteroidota bacterium]
MTDFVEKKLIGTYAIFKLGSNRRAKQLNYLVNQEDSTKRFIFDTANKTKYTNANGFEFFRELRELERRIFHETATPQSLFELRAFDLLLSYEKGDYSEINDYEFDLKFLYLRYQIKEVKALGKYISAEELEKIQQIINDPVYF